MPDPIPAAASSLPRTLEMALKICDFDATVWARRVVVAPDDWAWLSVVLDAGRLWIVELTPTDDAAEVPKPELGPAWTEADRHQFEHASLAAQYATLHLLDDLYIAIAAIAGGQTGLAEQHATRQAATLFVTSFSAIRPGS